MKSLEATSQNTANSIYAYQNDDFIIDCLVAQRNEYTRAKMISLWKTIVTHSVAIVSVLASIIDIEVFSAISGLLAVCLLISNKWMESMISAHKKHAAAVQQYVDVTLYSKVLGTNKSIWGDIPGKSDLAESISKYKKTDRNKLRNWYSDYSSLSAEQQILYCQKENIRWNTELNKKYKYLSTIVLFVALLIMIISFVAVNPSFIKFLCILTWIAPWVDYCYSIFSDINQSMELFKKANKTFSHIERLTDANSNLIDNLVTLQHQIRNIREEGFLIPDWFYKRFQCKCQKTEDQIADSIVSQNIESSEKI